MGTFLAVLTGGGLALVGGLLSGWLTNWLGARRDERKYAHEKSLALEARRQERLEHTYSELLGYLSHYRAWALSIRPLLGSVTAPEPLTDQDRWRIEALVAMHGSAEVRRLLEEWGRYPPKIQDADYTIQMAETRRPSPQLEAEVEKAEHKLPQRKAAMDAADAKIRDRVRLELAGIPEPPPPLG